MSRLSLGCIFCDKETLNGDGTVLIKRKAVSKTHDLELFHEDDRNLAIYFTERETMNPEAKMTLQINNCPMCGRNLYEHRRDRNEEYDYPKKGDHRK